MPTLCAYFVRTWVSLKFSFSVSGFFSPQKRLIEVPQTWPCFLYRCGSKLNSVLMNLFQNQHKLGAFRTVVMSECPVPLAAVAVITQLWSVIPQKHICNRWQPDWSGQNRDTNPTTESDTSGGLWESPLFWSLLCFELSNICFWVWDAFTENQTLMDYGYAETWKVFLERLNSK